DDAILDPFHALTAAVDSDDRDALLPARRLEGRVTAVGRRLVDGVDQIDVRRLLENVLHRLPAAFGGAFRIVRAYDLRAVALGIVLGILDLDPEAGEEAVVTQIIDGRLVGRQVERRDLGVLGLVAERPLGPLADAFAGLEIVGGEIGVRRRDRIERSVERDDHDAGLAGLLDRRND